MNGPLGPASMRRVGDVWLAENAVVLADVVLEPDVNVWFGVTIRGDDAPIRIGARTNVQDGAIVHVDPGRPNVIGRGVTIGHGAICHGVRIGDHALIGMGAVLLSGSEIGEGAVVGAGAVVREEQVVPPFSLVVGVPARVARTLEREARLADAREKADGYVEQARLCATTSSGSDPDPPTPP